MRSDQVKSDRVLTVGISAQGPQACVAPFALVSRISSARRKHRQLNKLTGGNTVYISSSMRKSNTNIHNTQT